MNLILMLCLLLLIITTNLFCFLSIRTSFFFLSTIAFVSELIVWLCFFLVIYSSLSAPRVFSCFSCPADPSAVFRGVCALPPPPLLLNLLYIYCRSTCCVMAACLLVLGRCGGGGGGGGAGCVGVAASVGGGGGGVRAPMSHSFDNG